MEENRVEWLPHLTSEVVADARGPEFDAYLVALEGWRRGLTLKWHVKNKEKFSEMKTWFVDKPGKLFSLSSKDKTHYFFRTRGDKVSNEAVEIGADKEQTKIYLTQTKVRTPEGKRFFPSSQNNEEIFKYASKIGYPIVLKPTDGSFGRGVITNIGNEEELINALNYLCSDLNYTDVIVERFIPGKEYRIYVIDEQVVAAIHRIPANVLGDGFNTIQTLIEMKNEERKRNPRLISCLIKVNNELKEFLSKAGYHLESVPEKNERIFLTDKSNISIGGDPVDVLDILPEEIKNTAIRAIKAIPGLNHGAVDLIIEEDKPVEQAGVVLEINPTAQIGSLLFPMKGKARDVPAAIIDFYFPETKEMVTEKERIYFDFNDVLEPLLTKTASTTMVSAAPVGKIYAKKYTVSGDVQGIDYHRGLRKQAFERKLSGYVTNLENGDIDIVVLGTDENNVNDFKNAITGDPERSDVRGIRETDWTEPVKVGFEVKVDLKLQIEQLKHMKQEMDALQKELRQVERQYKKYYNSLSWQLMTPFRKIADLVKYFRRLAGK
ncbi:D-alanine-D-alanine ligase [Evansella caseinilytica]|uniref:Acylphosphatase n=1 Tax=Evansella caseinilytica TaxID=1503961 RepID=A0A1H3TZA9_9BACI|nr:acylphosphatase [Evansella caseinilytica]SDZ55543.1 D-alanine-D-alanine ligase [Evansella caseinilytica]